MVLTIFPTMIWRVFGNPPRWKAHGWAMPIKGYKTVSIDSPELAEIVGRRTACGTEVEIEGNYPNRIVVKAKSLDPIDTDKL